MITGDAIVNSTDLWNSLEPVILGHLSPLITIFKAVGIAILVYIIFLIVKALFMWRTNNKIMGIAGNVVEMNKKLDKLIEILGNKKKK